MLPMTEFGLMQITRERVRENIMQSMNDPCPYCDGTGLLTKKSNMIHGIEDWLKRYKLEGGRHKLTLKIHPSLGAKLKEGFISTFTRIQLKYFIRLKLVEDEKINPQAFRFVNSKSGEDITQQFT